MFDQTKGKEMENKQVSWEKAKNDQKKKKTENGKVALHDKVTLSQMGFLEATRTKLPCDWQNIEY